MVDIRRATSVVTYNDHTATKTHGGRVVLVPSVAELLYSIDNGRHPTDVNKARVPPALGSSNEIYSFYREADFVTLETLAKLYYN